MYMSRTSPNTSLLRKVFFFQPSATLRLQGYEPSAAEAFGIEKMEGGVTRLVQALKNCRNVLRLTIYVCIYIFPCIYI